METTMKTESSGPTSVRDKIREAFKELRSMGIYSRMNYKCCQSCGSYEIVDDAGEDDIGYAFFHAQDDDGLRKTGTTYIAYGSLDEDETSAYEVGMFVSKTLADQGLEVFWKKDESERIQVGRRSCSKWSCDEKAEVFFDYRGTHGYCEDHVEEASDEAERIEDYQIEPVDDEDLTATLEDLTPPSQRGDE